MASGNRGKLLRKLSTGDVISDGLCYARDFEFHCHITSFNAKSCFLEHQLLVGRVNQQNPSETKPTCVVQIVPKKLCLRMRLGTCSTEHMALPEDFPSSGIIVCSHATLQDKKLNHGGLWDCSKNYEMKIEEFHCREAAPNC